MSGIAAIAGLLVCPACESGLRQSGDDVACSSCGRGYPVVSGIPCFSPTDPFYDTYAEHHAPFVREPEGLKRAILSTVPFWSWREWRFWSAAVPSCERLLDVGCGRGQELFARRARQSVGYDVSMRFVREAAENYTAAAQGSLPRLPFAASSFDVVVTSHVLGHIPVVSKDVLIREMARVLVPGGVSAHLIETESGHPIVRGARANEPRYHAQFVQQDGHIGLEPASRVVERFRAAGFQLLRMRLVDALLPSRQTFDKYLDHPEFDGIPAVPRLRRLYRITRNPLLNLAYEVAMGTVHRTAEQWWGDPDHAQFVMVVFRKERR